MAQLSQKDLCSFCDLPVSKQITVTVTVAGNMILVFSSDTKGTDFLNKTAKQRKNLTVCYVLTFPKLIFFKLKLIKGQTKVCHSALLLAAAEMQKERRNCHFLPHWCLKTFIRHKAEATSGMITVLPWWHQRSLRSTVKVTQGHRNWLQLYCPQNGYKSLHQQQERISFLRHPSN